MKPYKTWCNVILLSHVCRRILDDLSSADATLKAAGTDPLALAAAATLQAQQVRMYVVMISTRFGLDNMAYNHLQMKCY